MGPRAKHGAHFCRALAAGERERGGRGRVLVATLWSLLPLSWSLENRSRGKNVGEMP